MSSKLLNQVQDADLKMLAIRDFIESEPDCKKAAIDDLLKIADTMDVRLVAHVFKRSSEFKTLGAIAGAAYNALEQFLAKHKLTMKKKCPATWVTDAQSKSKPPSSSKPHAVVEFHQKGMSAEAVAEHLTNAGVKVGADAKSKESGDKCVVKAVDNETVKITNKDGETVDVLASLFLSQYDIQANDEDIGK